MIPNKKKLDNRDKDLILTKLVAVKTPKNKHLNSDRMNQIVFDPDDLQNFEAENDVKEGPQLRLK